MKKNCVAKVLPAILEIFYMKIIITLIPADLLTDSSLYPFYVIPVRIIVPWGTRGHEKLILQK